MTMYYFESAMVVRNVLQRKRRFVVEGKILMKGKYSDNFQVLLIPPGQINNSELWVSLKNLISTNANRTNVCDKSFRSKYFLPLTVEG